MDKSVCRPFVAAKLAVLFDNIQVGCPATCPSNFHLPLVVFILFYHPFPYPLSSRGRRLM